MVLVAVLWVCADWLGRIKKLSNRVGAQAGVLTELLRRDQAGSEGDQLVKFERGSVRAAIEDNWAGGTSPPRFPTSILSAPDRP